MFISFLFSVIENMNYLKLYGSSINFDNIYVTEYFLRRDARRKRLGKESLLPLKKIEENGLISSLFSSRLSDQEQDAKS